MKNLDREKWVFDKGNLFRGLNGYDRGVNMTKTWKYTPFIYRCQVSILDHPYSHTPYRQVLEVCSFSTITIKEHPVSLIHSVTEACMQTNGYVNHARRLL